MYVDPHTHLHLTRIETERAVRRQMHHHDLRPAAQRSRIRRWLSLVRPHLGTIRTAGRTTVSVPVPRRQARAEAL